MLARLHQTDRQHKKMTLLRNVGIPIVLVLCNPGAALARHAVPPIRPALPPAPPARPVVPLPPAVPVHPVPVLPIVVRVTAASLNVRRGPGTRYAVIGTTRRGVQLTVRGASGGWLKVVTPRGVVGWVSSNYTARVR